MKAKLIALFFLMGISSAAHASPFCIAGMGMPPQCIYDDIQVCRQAASANTSCVANPETLLNYSGGARYCTVTSHLSAQCIFNDRAQCRKEASLRKEICIDRMDVTNVNNPYRFDSRIQE